MSSSGISFTSLAMSANTIPQMVQPYLPTGWVASVIPDSSPDDPVRYSKNKRIVYIPTPPESEEATVHYLARIHTVLGTVDQYGVSEMEEQSSFDFYKADGTAHPIAWVYNDLLALELYKRTLYEGRKQVLAEDMETLFKELDVDNLTPKMLRYHKALADICIATGMNKVTSMGSSKYLDRFITQELKHSMTLRSLYDLAQKIIDKLDDEDPEEEDEEPMGKPSQSQEELPANGSPELGDGIGRPDEVAAENPCIPSYTSSEIWFDDDAMKVRAPYIPPFGDHCMTVDYTKEQDDPMRRTFGVPGSLTATDDRRVARFDMCSDYGLDGERDYKTVVAQGLPLARQLRSLLTEETRTRRSISTRGRMTGGRLYQIATGGEAVYGRTARKQFIEATTSYDMNSHLTILVDLSGSMGGSKAVYAAATLNVLYQALAPLHASFSVIGFTDNHSGHAQLAMKRMFDSRTESRILEQRDITHRLDKAFGSMAANPDTDAVFYAALDAMQAKKAKRKIILVLSDGSPSSFRSSGAHPGQLKALVKQISDTPNFTIFGLGIRTDAVKQFYPDYEVISKVDDILPAVLSFVHTAIIKQTN